MLVDVVTGEVLIELLAEPGLLVSEEKVAVFVFGLEILDEHEDSHIILRRSIVITTLKSLGFIISFFSFKPTG
jgi:hypothetical protein